MKNNFIKTTILGVLLLSPFFHSLKAQTGWSGATNPVTTQSQAQINAITPAPADATLPNTKLLIQEDNPWIELKDVTGYNAGAMGPTGAKVGIKFTTPASTSPYDVSVYPGAWGHTFSMQRSSNNLGFHVTSSGAWVGIPGLGLSVSVSGDAQFYSGVSFTSTVNFNGPSAVRMGNVALPTSNQYKLIVGTGIITEKIKVAVNNTADWSWPDYAFQSTYRLKPLSEVETYVNEHHHLPGVPSQDEVVKEGIDLVQMDAALLLKIEELTLYMIQLKKENEELRKQQQELMQKIENNELK